MIQLRGHSLDQTIRQLLNPCVVILTTGRGERFASFPKNTRKKNKTIKEKKERKESPPNLHFLPRELTRRTKADSEKGGNRAGANSPLLTSTSLHSLHPDTRTAAEVEGTDSLGTVDLVATDGHEVNVEVIDVNGDLASGLRAVCVEEHLALTAQLTDFLEGLNDSNLIVHCHHGNKHCIGTNGFLQLLVQRKDRVEKHELKLKNRTKKKKPKPLQSVPFPSLRFCSSCCWRCRLPAERLLAASRSSLTVPQKLGCLAGCALIVEGPGRSIAGRCLRDFAARTRSEVRRAILSPPACPH